MSQPVITLRGRLARRVREEAERLGVTVEEYLVELLSQSLDPKDRAREYVEAARELLEEAREELERRSDIRQASEKLWGATALAIKAYALWREGRRLRSHGELWEYKDKIAAELGEWVRDVWNAANSMHVCFYEGWCTWEDVEKAYGKVERLVEAVAFMVEGSQE